MSRTRDGVCSSRETLRLGLESFPAPLAAEPDSLPFVAEGCPGTDSVDDHAAYGVVRPRVPFG